MLHGACDITFHVNVCQSCMCTSTSIITHKFTSSVDTPNEQPSRNPRRVAHCRFSSLVSFTAKANLLAIETALLARRQQSADHNRDKVCQVGVTVNTYE